jgi:isocitrate dehydrogenase kinase/phosphatase
VSVESGQAARAADAVYAAFDQYHRRFRDITGRAALYFAAREWRTAQRDAAARLALYKAHVDQAVAVLRQVLAATTTDRESWAAMRNRYAELIRGRDDSEIAETFFNSITRRVFTTVGVDPRIEFVSPGGRERDAATTASGYQWFPASGSVQVVAHRILECAALGAPYADLDGDARRLARAIGDRMGTLWGREATDGVDLVPWVFYRNKGAYLVGRMRRGRGIVPLVIALLNTPEGVIVDAALTTSDEASIVFGFSWSYFHVNTPWPRALVEFLRSIMPLKRTDELYTAIGYNKHGKTELYRSILDHLHHPEARFEEAEGTRGLVMAVFTLPSLNVVFKIIRDTFGPPKKTTRREVIDRYQFVFVRDRVGRLADVQEFEHLEFPRSCFPDELLRELLDVAPSSVHVDGERVIVTHVYTERRLTPLNVYLATASEDDARDVIIDYGNAIKDLAHADIFTGDMLLKNFGVSRHGRVIFYDYDELSTLSACNFRELPESASVEEELAPEPWFSVQEHDVFPQEFLPFLVPEGPLREAFLEAHAELLDVHWWKSVQERLSRGELFDVFPYHERRRLRPAEARAAR